MAWPARAVDTGAMLVLDRHPMAITRGTMTDEQGKPFEEAKGEVEYAASFLEWFGGEAERIAGQWLPSAQAEVPSRS